MLCISFTPGWTLLECEGMQSGIFLDDDVPPPSPDMDGEEICDKDINDDSSLLPQPESPSLQLPCVWRQ